MKSQLLSGALLLFTSLFHATSAAAPRRRGFRGGAVPGGGRRGLRGGAVPGAVAVGGEATENEDGSAARALQTAEDGGKCTINCNCYGEDCSRCSVNCQCYGACFMPRCYTVSVYEVASEGGGQGREDRVHETESADKATSKAAEGVDEVASTRRPRAWMSSPIVVLTLLA